MHALKLAMAAGCVALLSMPVAANAQSDTSSGASNMKGPPNANGFGKDEGIQKQNPVVGNGGTDQDHDMPSASNMKGPPNANGYGK